MPERLNETPLNKTGKPDQRSQARIDEPEVRGIIVGAIAAGATVETAAHIARVSEAVVYDRKAKDEEFRMACDQARAKTTALLGMTAVRVALTQGHPQQATMLIFCLKNFDPTHWRDRHELEVAIGDVSQTLREAAEEARERRRLRAAGATMVEAQLVDAEPFEAEEPSGNGHGSNGGGG